MKKWKFLLLLTASMQLLTLSTLMGCAGADIQNQLERLKGAATRAPARPAPKIEDTPLAGILRESAGNGSEYPRVAIVDLRIPARAKANPYDMTDYPENCMTFSAVIWTDRNTSKQVPATAVCHDDLDPKTNSRWNNRWATNWVNKKAIENNTTGLKRTTGPVPPSTVMPYNPTILKWIDTGPGQVYFANMLLKMGFPPESDSVLQKTSSWVVNVVE